MALPIEVLDRRPTVSPVEHYCHALYVSVWRSLFTARGLNDKLPQEFRGISGHRVRSFRSLSQIPSPLLG